MLDILSLDVFDGAAWTYDVFRDDINNADAWKNVNVDLTAYVGNPSVILSWTVWFVATQGWQCDIALDYIVVNGSGGGGGPPPAKLNAKLRKLQAEHSELHKMHPDRKIYSRPVGVF